MKHMSSRIYSRFPASIVIFLALIIANFLSFTTVAGAQIPSEFEEAFDHLNEIAEKAPLEAFKHWDGKRGSERDRQDVLLTIVAEKERYNSYPSGVVFGLISALQDGKFSPKCAKGSAIDNTCLDSGRWMVFSPELERSLRLSELSDSMGIWSEFLARHYRHGWLVDKDLVVAYDLYMKDKGRPSGEYYWANINEMIQEELNSLGEHLKTDSDFGGSSCAALVRHIGKTACKKVVTRDQVVLLAARYPSRFSSRSASPTSNNKEGNAERDTEGPSTRADSSTHTTDGSRSETTVEVPNKPEDRSQQLLLLLALVAGVGIVAVLFMRAKPQACVAPSVATSIPSPTHSVPPKSSAPISAPALQSQQSVASNQIPNPQDHQAHDLIKVLERLAQLRENGILTDAEFEQEKKRILDG